MNRLRFSPDPLILTWQQRAEARLWRWRIPYALLGWLFILFPERSGDARTDDIEDVRGFLVVAFAAALVLGALAILGEVSR